MSESKLRPCDGCSTHTEETDQLTCCSSHVDLYDFGSNESGCYDDQFYCKKCLNEQGFCKVCAKKNPLKIQINIGKYLDTGNCIWKK